LRTHRRPRSTRDEGNVLFSQPGASRGSRKVDKKSLGADISKLTQDIFRKRVGGHSEKKRLKRSFEQKQRSQRIGTPVSNSGLFGGGGISSTRRDANSNSTNSGLKIRPEENKEGVASQKISSRDSSSTSNIPIRQMVEEQKIQQPSRRVQVVFQEGKGTKKTPPREADLLTGWATEMLNMSEPSRSNGKMNSNKPEATVCVNPAKKKEIRPVLLKYQNVPSNNAPEVRFTYSSEAGNETVPKQETIDKRLNGMVSPPPTNVKFSPMVVRKQKSINLSVDVKEQGKILKKKLLDSSMPKKVEWDKHAFMLPSKAAHSAAAAAKVPYDRVLPSLPRGVENFAMRLGGIHLKQSIDVLPPTVEHLERTEMHDSDDEEVIHNPAFATAKSAAQFWLRNLLRTHNFKQATATGGWRGKEHVRRLAEFLASAVSHVRYAVNAEGWTAPDRAELERQIYNIVVDELSEQVASHATSRGSLLEMITAHFQDVVGDALPVVIGRKDNEMKLQNKEMERVIEENKRLVKELTRLRKDTETIANTPPTISIDTIMQEAEAAKRLVTSRDAEIIALRRQISSLKRSLDQAQSQAQSQCEELQVVRSNLMQREDESIQKVKMAKEVAVQLRKELTQALTKVAKAEEAEQWLEEQNFPQKISEAEKRIQDAKDSEQMAKKKLHNANRTELALYSKVKDLEQFTLDMEGSIRDLKGYQNLMQGMMGRVESIRRASVAIRHNIPVSKLSGDPAVMQEVVNRMTTKAMEAEKKMKEVITVRDKLERQLSLEKQKVQIQGQQVLDAREAQSRLEMELFELHEDFDSTVTELRDSNEHLRAKVDQLNSENEFLMEHAGSPGSESNSRIEVTEDAVLHLKMNVADVKKEHEGIMHDTQEMLLEFESLFASLASRVNNRPVGQKDIKMFTDSILEAAQPSPVTKPIGRRRSIQNLKSKKRAKKRVKKRRMTLDKKFTDEDAANDEKFEVAVELAKFTLQREKEVLEQRVLMMQLEFEAATKKQEETIRKTEKDLKDVLENNEELKTAKAKVAEVKSEIDICKQNLEVARAQREEKEMLVAECQEKLEGAIVRMQEEELRLDDIVEIAKKDEQRVLIAQNKSKVDSLNVAMKTLREDLKISTIEFDRLEEVVSKFDREMKAAEAEAIRIETEDSDLKELRELLERTKKTEIKSLKQLSGTRRRLRTIKNDLDDEGHLRNKAAAVLRTAGRKGVDEEQPAKSSNPAEHEKKRDNTVRDLAAKQAKALFTQNKVASAERQLEEARAAACQKIPELGNAMDRLKTMREEREKSELMLIQLRKDMKISLDEKSEHVTVQSELEVKMSKVKEQIRKSQLQYDMKISIKQQTKKAMLEAGEMPPSEEEKDEEEMKLETHLLDVKLILEECKKSWEEADKKISAINQKKITIETALTQKVEKIEELDQECDRVEDDIAVLEGEDQALTNVRNDFLEAVEEEMECLDEVAATQAAVELLDTESAEIQEAEEERIRQKREAAKREREEEVAASKPREIEIEEEVTELVVDADGTTREVKKKVKRKVQMKPGRARGTQTAVVVSKEAANAAMPMLKSLSNRVKDERTFLNKIRKDTRSSLQRMGGELSAFANKLGDRMGMSLQLQKIVLKEKPPTPEKPSNGSEYSSKGAVQSGATQHAASSRMNSRVKEDKPKLDDSLVPGTSSWLANNVGALEEFNRVQEEMKKEIDSLSAEQRQLHDVAATKIQAIVRGKHGKNVVKAIRKSLQREEEATQALLEFGAAEDEDAGDVQMDSMRRIMNLDGKLSKIESQNNLKKAEEKAPDAWDQGKIEDEKKRQHAKMTEQDRAIQRAQMERSIKLRKRVITIEKRVKELENILTRKFASKFKMMGAKQGKKSGGIGAFVTGGSAPAQEDNMEDGDVQADRLANTPGSVGSVGAPRFHIPKLIDYPKTDAEEIPEEKDNWADKPSWDGLMPGLRKGYPSTSAKDSTPGGANPNEWRSKVEFSRGAWGHRVERYRLNKQSFHDLLRKRAGLTPAAALSTGGLDGVNSDLSKSVSDKLKIPSEWGDRAPTPVSLEHDETDGSTKKSLEPRPIAWVIKSIRSVYDDKLLAECAAFRNGFQAPTLPEYLCEWASVRYGVNALVEQMCWDLYRSVQFYRTYSIEVDTFANFMDEFYSPADLSFFLYTRALVLDTMGEASSAAQSNLAPAPVPLSVAIKISSRVLAGLQPVHLAAALHKFDVNAKPNRRMDATKEVDIASLFAEAKEVDSFRLNMSSKLNTDEGKTHKQQKTLLAFKEKMLLSCSQDSSSTRVVTKSGEREIDSQRFLYLCLREFRSAQRRFKRTMKDSLKMTEFHGGFDAITEGEFVTVSSKIVPNWSRDEAEMVFRQGKIQVENTREKDGFSTTDATRVPGKILVKLGTQMWCHTFLLPHARISDPYDPDGKVSLERRLQTLLGAVSSHWPSFEPSLNRLANRVGKAISMSHGQSPSRDQGLRGDKSTLSPNVSKLGDGSVTFNAHRKKPSFTPFHAEN
jgi:hypothetical protein